MVLLLFQIAAILATCRVLHGIAGRLGQPPVTGEIVAGLLLGPSLGQNIGLTALVIALAIAGKVGGAFVGGRLTGFDIRNGLALGCLLNTRGPVELIVLNVGLDLGLLSPPLFSMMVIMALVTTVITTPALRVVFPQQYRQSAA